jgi:FlaA1/EpsC-like NDP-sugar epimerase
MSKPRVFVVGAGGHAKVVLDILERDGRYDIAFLIDENPSLKGTDVYGYRVLGNGADLAALRDTPSHW